MAGSGLGLGTCMVGDAADINLSCLPTGGGDYNSWGGGAGSWCMQGTGVNWTHACNGGTGG